MEAEIASALTNLAADAPLLFLIGYWLDTRLKHGCGLLERAVQALEAIAKAHEEDEPA